jgi:hypothetical protein
LLELGIAGDIAFILPERAAAVLVHDEIWVAFAHDPLGFGVGRGDDLGDDGSQLAGGLLRSPVLERLMVVAVD